MPAKCSSMLQNENRGYSSALPRRRKEPSLAASAFIPAVAVGFPVMKTPATARLSGSSRERAKARTDSMVAAPLSNRASAPR